MKWQRIGTAEAAPASPKARESVVTQTSLISAAAAIAMAIVPLVSGSTEAADGTSAAVAAATRNAMAERQLAVSTCVGYNSYGPARVVDAVEDGMGDWLVWVKDKDGDLWMCNASGEGGIYAYALIQGDLLKGDGEQTLASVPAAAIPDASGPAANVEKLCAAVGEMMEDVTVAATTADGLGDYIVWLKNSSGSYWVCNASTEGKLYVFEPVHYPLNQNVVPPEQAFRRMA